MLHSEVHGTKVCWSVVVCSVEYCIVLHCTTVKCISVQCQWIAVLYNAVQRIVEPYMLWVKDCVITEAAHYNRKPLVWWKLYSELSAGQCRAVEYSVGCSDAPGQLIHTCPSLLPSLSYTLSIWTILILTCFHIGILNTKLAILYLTDRPLVAWGVLQPAS